MEGYYEFTKEQFDRIVDELSTIMDNYTATQKAERIYDILGIDYTEVNDWHLRELGYPSSLFTIKERKGMKKFLKITFMIVVLLILVTSICVMVSNAKDKPVPEKKTGYIFIGDSRMIGMNNVVHIDNMNDTFLVTKIDAGYDWYMKEGSHEVYDIRCSHSEYTDWTYVFNLGINDLENVENYKNLYRELSYEATMYYVSVNPTNDEVSDIKCDDVYEFNKELRYGISDDDYINTYDYLTKVSGFNFAKKKDGVNYDNDTYITIYDFIMTAIDVHEFVRQNDGRYSAYYYLYNAR